MAGVKETLIHSTYEMVLNPHFIYLISACMLALLFVFYYVWDPLGIGKNDTGGAAGTILCLVFVTVVYASWAQSHGAADKTTTGLKKEWKDGRKEIWHSLLYIALLWGLCGWAVSTSKLAAATLSKLPSWVLLTGHLLLVVSILGGLAVLYFLLRKPINAAINQPGRSWFGTLLALLKETIFYLPCLIADAIAQSKKEWADTPTMVWIVLLLEAAFIGCYFLVPRLVKYVESWESEQLLPKPVYLNYVTPLGPIQQQVNAAKQKKIEARKRKLDREAGTLMSPGEKRFMAGWTNFVAEVKSVLYPGEVTKEDYSLSYAVSCWFRINPQPTSSKGTYTTYANILDYGGRPRIEYNMSLKTLRVREVLYGKKQMVIAEYDDVPLQRWNNVVINYDGATMDVFLNGVLIGSRPGVAPCIDGGDVTAGSDHGVEGGIVNVQYHNAPLKIGDLRARYARLKDANPPVS